MNPTGQPLVSIIMTAYNEERYIADTLRALIAQSHGQWEALVVDDGSTDSTPRIISEFSARESRIIPILRENKGRIAALNEAIARARGSFIAVNDADDIPSPDRLAKEVQFLQSHEDHGMVGSYARITDANGIPTGDKIVAPSAHADIRKVMLRYNPFVHSSVMYRKEALESAGPYTDKFLPGFEWEMCANIMRNWKVANIPEYLVLYRIHSKSLTRSRRAWTRFTNATRARWYVFRTLRYPWYYLPLVASGIRDLL